MPLICALEGVAARSEALDLSDEGRVREVRFPESRFGRMPFPSRFTLLSTICALHFLQAVGKVGMTRPSRFAASGMTHRLIGLPHPHSPA